MPQLGNAGAAVGGFYLFLRVNIQCRNLCVLADMALFNILSDSDRDSFLVIFDEVLLIRRGKMAKEIEVLES